MSSIESEIPASTSAPAPETSTSAGVDEDEAALYDRQIRLWGLEAQNRMRKSHVLVYNIFGVATEVIKNIVLSGIGTLTIVDDALLSETDLASGFFYRQEQVGSYRVEAALPRIQALNPLVKVRAVTDLSILQDQAALQAEKLDVLVATKGSRTQLTNLNSLCRYLSIKFYASEAQGFGGWIFSDLGPAHEYICEFPVAPPTNADPSSKTNNQPTTRKVKKSQAFASLEKALDHDWRGEKRNKLKRMKLSPGFFATLAFWECNARGDFDPSKPGPDPSSKPLLMRIEPDADNIAKESDQAAVESEEVERELQQAKILKETAQRIMEEKGVPQELVFQAHLGADPDTFFQDFIRATISSGAGDFSPTCAVLGGLLAQDVLNALGGREETLCNWFQFDGSRGPVHQLAVSDPVDAQLV